MWANTRPHTPAFFRQQRVLESFAHMPRRLVLRLALLLVGLMLAYPWLAYAQIGNRASLGSPAFEDFPTVRTTLNIYNSSGDFVRSLDPRDVRILENEQTLSVDELVLSQPGVQFVVALNPGASFAIRDSKGISRFDMLRDELVTWASGIPISRQDDLSLLTSDGPETTHTNNPREWLRALENYLTDARGITPSFDLLGRAITVAADSTRIPGMGRAVLFISPPPDQDAALVLQNLASIAQQQDVHIFVWIVASQAMFDSTGANQLADLALQSGGQAFMFSGVESFPSIESYIEPLRYIYELTYRSQIRSSGTHQVSARIDLGGEEITTIPRVFELQVEPPNPVFLSPPTIIERSALVSDESEPEILLPRQQLIEVVIEFPDGHPRNLVRSTLSVDGVPVDVKIQAPFDRFIWGLEEHNQNGEHRLQVAVEDNLGLVGESIETAVRISIKTSPTQILAILSRRAPMIAVLLALLAGAILLWVLVVAGRLKPQGANVLGRSRRRADKDPLTQPVPARAEPPIQRASAIRIARRNASQFAGTITGRISGGLSGLAQRFSWPQRRSQAHPLAYLERLSENGFSISATPTQLILREYTLGRSQSQTSLVVDDPAVADLHARLVWDLDGSFYLHDQNTVAGTWVNYTLVPERGVRLEHGDLVHIGRVGFRFTLAEPNQIRKPIITYEEHAL